MSDRSYYDSVKPNQAAIRDLRMLWSWKNRANLFKFFLDDYEKIFS